MLGAHVRTHTHTACARYESRAKRHGVVRSTSENVIILHRYYVKEWADYYRDGLMTLGCGRRCNCKCNETWKVHGRGISENRARKKDMRARARARVDDYVWKEDTFTCRINGGFVKVVPLSK